MKLKITLAFVVLLFALSCKKSSNPAPLIGKWTVVSSVAGNGGPEAFFTALNPGPDYIQFGEGGAIESNFFVNCIKYSLSGNNVVFAFDYGSTSGNQNFTYTYSVTSDKLILNGVTCVGCQVILAKQ
jgi:hypothetical protein